MERNFKRISNGLNLPQESRERIRSELVSYQKKQGNFEGISTEKSTFKSRIPFIVAAIVTAMVLTLTAAAAVAHLFKNNIIVPSSEDIPISSSKNTNVPANGDGAIVSPAGNAPATLEKIIQSKRAKSDDWSTGDMISAGVIPEYYQWDFVEVLSNDPVLRSRRVGRKDGAEKIEYTAEHPVNLIDTLTGRVTFDLKWLNENYNYVPDANLSFVVSDTEGNYISEAFDALYAKKDSSGYVDIQIYNVTQADYFSQGYIIDGSYETAYYYTSVNGYEFVITANGEHTWAECNTRYTSVKLHGAYLTTDDMEEIINNLSLSVLEEH